LTEHLRLNGVYWGLIALHLLGRPDALPRDKTIEYVLACQNADGGFGAAPKHDSHMLYTTSAVQILATVDALSALDATGGRDKVGECMLSPVTLVRANYGRYRCSPGSRFRLICW
jgi:geranylgeranyl transferase type-2 subunit beta